MRISDWILQFLEKFEAKIPAITFSGDSRIPAVAYSAYFESAQ